MKTLETSKLLDAFRMFSCEPPAGYAWAIEHKLFGFEEFTQFEPWFFCSLEEILPLSKRWPSVKAEGERLPFARRQDRDDLACFRLNNGRIVEICVIHYNLGPPPSWETCKTYKTFWDWVRGIINDTELWCDMQQ